MTVLRDNIPVGVITARQLSRLSDYRVVVLADAVRLSDDEAAAFANYVERGGNLYVSGKTASHSLTGRAAVNPLASCLGVTLNGTLPGNTFYLNPDDDEWRRLCAPQPSVCIHEAIEDIAACAAGVSTGIGRTALRLPARRVAGRPALGQYSQRTTAAMENTRSAVTRVATGRDAPSTQRPCWAGKTPCDRAYAAVAGCRPAGRRAQLSSRRRHVWFTVFHQPDERRYVLHLLLPGRSAPSPLRDLQISVRKRAGISFTRLLQMPQARTCRWCTTRPMCAPGCRNLPTTRCWCWSTRRTSWAAP
jgi:hypothetical protein